MITHVKFVSIPTSDQDRAVAFWTEQVGFTLVTDQPFSDAQRWIELAVGDSITHFVLFTPDGHEGTGSAASSTARSPATTSRRPIASSASAASTSTARRRSSRGGRSQPSGTPMATSSCSARVRVQTMI